MACSALCGLGLMTAGCQTQSSTAQNSPVDRFNARLGVSSSPRVVEDGRPIPRGGGVYRVGRAYTVAGRRYTPTENQRAETGVASWYGRQFHGRLTANGEVYDMHSLSAAHRTMPMPSYARVTNLTNGHSLIVRVNDRGPFHHNRVIDLSGRASHLLNFRHHGVARVRVEYVGRAPLEGTDDRMLLATLRTDGSPAPRPGNAVMPTMIASAEPATRAAEAAPVREAAPTMQLASSESRAVTLPAAAPAEAQATMASAPVPIARPSDLAPAPAAVTTVARSREMPVSSSSTVTVAAAPAAQAIPASSAPVLATASSRPVSAPAASAYTAPAAQPAAIAAMPGGGPVRASLGFGSLY